MSYQGLDLDLNPWQSPDIFYQTVHGISKHNYKNINKQLHILVHTPTCTYVSAYSHFPANYVQGGPKKVSQILSAMTLSIVIQFS